MSKIKENIISILQVAGFTALFALIVFFGVFSNLVVIQVTTKD